MRAPRVTGSFSSAGGDIGAYVKTPDRCESGGHWNFYGVVFFEPGSTTSVLELVQDPVRGWALKAAWPAKHDMAVLEGKDCSKLDVDLHVERTRNNPEGWASGSARFVCRTPGGSTLQGDLKFTNCR